jgi:hypothetical protein
MGTMIEMPFAKGNHPSKPHDGMRQLLWVAKYQIGQPTYKQ